MDSSPSSAARRPHRHVGPPLVPLALISVALFAAASLQEGASEAGVHAAAAKAHHPTVASNSKSSRRIKRGIGSPMCGDQHSSND